MYEKLSRAKLEATAPYYWFERVAKHIAPQAESKPYVTDLNLVADLPAEVRAIYFLWMFVCEAGGNGIECFLLQQQGLFTPQVHEALRLVGATELVVRLEAAIPHAIKEESEFTFGPDMSWFRQFPNNSDYPTLQSVDKGVWKLINDDLVARCNELINQHKDVFLS